ncbi:unnamed protein product [Caenorhabditis sp. 36 PRJEB53466]|nr:unnamed protein product [Caenorhabditis sp. 36 PRJEB53466]
MQNKNDVHLVYRGNDCQVLKISHDKTCLEREFASEMTHDVQVCRFIQKGEIIAFEVSIYGKNKREGDFKLIIEPARSKKSDKRGDNLPHTPYVIEPPSVWIGNPQRGVFKFMIKLENESLLMRMDEDKDWFSVLYFPRTIDYYNIKMSLCKTVRTVAVGKVVTDNSSNKTPLPADKTKKSESTLMEPVCLCRIKPF